MDSPSTEPLPLEGTEKILVILCHLSAFIGLPFIFPFVLYLAKKKESMTGAAHAKEVLNFHLSLLLYAVISLILCIVGIGFLLLAGLGIFGFVCALIAAIKASDNVLFHYPLTIRFIK